MNNNVHLFFHWLVFPCFLYGVFELQLVWGLRHGEPPKNILTILQLPLCDINFPTPQSFRNAEKHNRNLHQLICSVYGDEIVLNAGLHEKANSKGGWGKLCMYLHIYKFQVFSSELTPLRQNSS